MSADESRAAALPSMIPGILPGGNPFSRTQSFEGGTLGAILLDRGRCTFTVWAPFAERVSVEILDIEGKVDRLEPLEVAERGYHSALLDEVEPGRRYRFLLESGGGEKRRPDPASRFQPEGVHGPSEVVAPREGWSGWRGRPLDECVFYELHVGTFTPEGTFDALIPRLDGLLELGVTAIELMPVAQFPGVRNWGYDGTFPFAPQNSYGGPAGLHRLVDACHERDLAVVLDVVYNHIGPEGNYLADFGPYFTDRYRTPWGRAINFDDAASDEVRHFFIENALYWVQEFRIDGLRLDAVHAIFDASATHFLEELAEAAHADAARDGRHVLVIAESDLNDPRLIREREGGGYGLDGQWSDDFHHALHTLVTGEYAGYYRDFGDIGSLADAWRHGFTYRGQFSAYRGRRHGRAPGADVPRHRFVVYGQNHDQVGNRAGGDRLSTRVDLESLKLVAATTLLSPFSPLLFMGEEYGELAPFPYFVHHGDPELVEAVRRGRREEFAAFGWGAEIPDPQSEETFRSAIPDPTRGEAQPHRALLELHRDLLALRRELQESGLLDSPNPRVETPTEKTLMVRRRGEAGEALLLLHFGDSTRTIEVTLGPGEWTRRFHTADGRWLGSGSALPERLEPARRGQGGEAAAVPEAATVLLPLPPRSGTLYLRRDERGARGESAGGGAPTESAR